MSKNKHIYPRYSIGKSELFRAGEILRADDFLTEKWNNAFELLSHWRAMHAYPLNTFQANIRGILKKTGKKAIVAQRLKRLPSILMKLSRFPSMRLGRMQDIGGIRIILSSVNDVYFVINMLKKAHWKHVLHNRKDYIQEPQKSGYRSFHLIYAYNNQQAPTEYQGLHIEIQVRTRLQHIWATAVETIGTFVEHSLKSSQGPEDWLEYLKLVSAVFAIEEKTPLPCDFQAETPQQLVSKLYNQTINLKVFPSLDSFHRAMKFPEDKRFKNKFILLKLDMANNKGLATIFNQKDLEAATIQYSEFEKNKTDNEDAVLVSSSSLKELKKAYPNYFIDSGDFLRQLNKIFKNYGLTEITIPHTNSES